MHTRKYHHIAFYSRAFVVWRSAQVCAQPLGSSGHPRAPWPPSCCARLLRMMDLFTDKSASGRPRKGVLRVTAASFRRQSSLRFSTFQCVPAGSSQSRDLSAPSVGHHDRICVVVVPRRAKVSTQPLSPLGGLRAPWPPSLLRQAPTAKSPVPSQFPHHSQASDAARSSGQCRFPSDGLYLLAEAGAHVSPSVDSNRSNSTPIG